jgi:hypothetical protein
MGGAMTGGRGGLWAMTGGLYGGRWAMGYGGLCQTLRAMVLWAMAGYGPDMAGYGRAKRTGLKLEVQDGSTELCAWMHSSYHWRTASVGYSMAASTLKEPQYSTSKSLAFRLATVQLEVAHAD